MAKLTTSYYLYFFGFVFALVIHFGVATLLFFSNKSSDYSVIGKQDYYIRAELYSVAEPQRREANKNEKEAILKARRLEEASFSAKQASIEQEIGMKREALPSATERIEALGVSKDRTKSKKRLVCVKYK